MAIHTPTQGVTKKEKEKAPETAISIHTPTQGVTAKSHNLHTRELCFSPKILYHSLRYYNSFRTNPHFFCILYYNLHVYLVRISQEIYVHLAFAPYNSYNILTILLAS